MKENKKGAAVESFVRDVYHRPNFLYQASCSVLKTVNSDLTLKIAACYGTLMFNVCKKLLLKLDKGIKRTICKGCGTLLIPGETAKIKIVKIGRKKRTAQKKKLVITCNLCSFKRSFHLKSEL